jgi:lipopolysaccharide export system permease protein
VAVRPRQRLRHAGADAAGALMLGKTLSLYFARHFIKMVGAIFLSAFLLIALITYFEFFNRALKGDFPAGFGLALMALFRVPEVSEESIAFSVLYGSIAAFVLANRRLEVVVARAAGVSAWQFLLPACVVGLLVGVLATTVYNPLAAWTKSVADRLWLEVNISSSKAPVPAAGKGAVWLRQADGGLEAIIGSTDSYDGGLGLVGATAYVFDGDGTFLRRIDAKQAHYEPGKWRFENAAVTAPSEDPKEVPNLELPTNLSPSEVKQTFLSLDSVSFWSLPGLSESARRAGLSSARYDLQYQVLLSRPILFVAMVLIAANVSLRFSRSRDLGRMIISGVGIGFMLYVVMQIAWDLGSGGIVPPPLAAWLPSIVAILAGVTVLLHLEDG